MSNKDFYAVDPPGTPNRRWACQDHIKQVGEVPEDVKELVNDIHEATREVDKDDSC
jgi:hypothetical protein